MSGRSLPGREGTGDAPYQVRRSVAVMVRPLL